MLETIYETDESVISDNDSSKSTNQQSRLSVYMCWCMITGCFLIITFIIAISLNPHYLSNNSISKNPQNISNTSFQSEDKLKLSIKIISYLYIFSYEVNELLDLELYPILFSTSPISNSSLELPNQSGILWIYGQLTYPQSCIDDSQCKENFHSKLKISFIELSDLLTTIELQNSYHDKQIQLDWCNLIENLTTASFVSLVSIRTINQNVTDKTMALDRLLCGDLDQNILLSKTTDDSVSEEDPVTTNSNPVTLDNQNLISTIDCNKNSMENGEETNMMYNNQVLDVKYRDDNNHQPTETAHCPNDTGTQYLLMWNSF